MKCDYEELIAFMTEQVEHENILERLLLLERIDSYFDNKQHLDELLILQKKKN